MENVQICMTALSKGGRFVACNVKHFPMLRDVWVPYEKAVQG